MCCMGTCVTHHPESERNKPAKNTEVAPQSVKTVKASQSKLLHTRRTNVTTRFKKHFWRPKMGLNVAFMKIIHVCRVRPASQWLLQLTFDGDKVVRKCAMLHTKLSPFVTHNASAKSCNYSGEISLQDIWDVS